MKREMCFYNWNPYSTEEAKHKLYEISLKAKPSTIIHFHTFPGTNHLPYQKMRSTRNLLRRSRVSQAALRKRTRTGSKETTKNSSQMQRREHLNDRSRIIRTWNGLNTE